MHHANISYTRDHLSELLLRVQEGESILILDRQKPVARLEPVSASPAPDHDGRADLARRGLLRVARQPLDLAAFTALPLPTPSPGCDAVAILLAEREDRA